MPNLMPFDSVEVRRLRTFDVVQFATALVLNGRRLGARLDGITLVSAGQELNMGAAAEGLLVEDPTLHW